MKVKDLYGNRHKTCPACGGDWLYIRKPNYIHCTKCSMVACIADRKLKNYSLTITIDKYFIYWNIYGCNVYLDDEDDAGIDLPILPFNINLEKLKTYLLFS